MMIKVFSDQTLWSVSHMKNLLSAANIDSEIRNEYAQGGVGELSFVDAWPELWVDADDSLLAKSVISEFESANTAGSSDWRCSCGEINGASFQSCWHCERERG